MAKAAFNPGMPPDHWRQQETVRWINIFGVSCSMLLYGLFIIRLIRYHTFNHIIIFDHRTPNWLLCHCYYCMTICSSISLSLWSERREVKQTDRQTDRQIYRQLFKLDGVGPVDNRPSGLHRLAPPICKKKKMWLVTGYRWHVTHDMWQVLNIV